MAKFSVFLIIAVIVMAAPVVRAQQGKDLVLAAGKALETSPTDKETRKTVKKAMKWIFETDDINVSLCRGAYGMIGDFEYKYREEMISAYTIGVAAFQIEDPSKTKDRNATHLAGIELTLKVYEGYVKDNPKSTSAMIDLLLEDRKTGKLAQTVATLNCGGNSEKEK
jgi:hypothetical protein